MLSMFINQNLTAVPSARSATQVPSCGILRSSAAPFSHALDGGVFDSMSESKNITAWSHRSKELWLQAQYSSICGILNAGRRGGEVRFRYGSKEIRLDPVSLEGHWLKLFKAASDVPSDHQCDGVWAGYASIVGGKLLMPQRN
jgi:hypothetical protein